MAAEKKKQTRKKNLVIVESPSKAKTIGKFLGSSYKVMASVGHVRDLPKSKLGIDIEDDFEPQYINIRGKGDIIKELKKEAKKANKVFLATDPDREGEAISWHLAYILGIDENEPCRIVFNEITKNAVKNAVKNPRKIDQGLVDAQQARRVLDRLVGYSISPILWRKVRAGLSAGRVQSAALRMICDREDEINNFIPKEYWNIDATFDTTKKGDKPFLGKLHLYKGEKFEINNEDENNKILDELSKGKYVVSNTEEKIRNKKPQPPYTTSSLQQDSANKNNFNVRRTMKVAQELYEGVKIKGRGTIGIISYIRTDSTRISEEARATAKEFILENYGEEYYGGNVYKSKKKEIQDAHEAIRPSYIELTPDEIKDSLTTEQYKLYRLIWNRFVASQMSNAQYYGVSADIANGDYIFRATGSKLKFNGFLKVYGSDKEMENLLPHIEKGDELEAIEVKGEQSFTQPPARFTEASLVKTLEEKNIGRPSTYAPITATLTDRRYIKRSGKSIVPTDLGFTVTKLLSEYFMEIVDTGFTAEMENKLDEVGVTINDWKQILRDFYGTFKEELKTADENIEKIEEEELTDIKCEVCGEYMVKKHGRFGEFLACSAYPECKNTKPIVKEIGVKCPDCGSELIERKSKRGKIFYGCSGYPNCKKVYWSRPVDKKCPECGELLVEKNTKTFTGLVCSNTKCEYKEKLEG